MKLTIEIPDAHTGAILEFVSALVAKSIPVEGTTDHAPGHPELPWPVAGELDGPTDEDGKLGHVAAADPLKVAMDDPVEGIARAIVQHEADKLDAEIMAASLPSGIPAPPAGFVFLSLDPLSKPADDPTFNLIWFNGDEWVTHFAWHGTSEGPWAARIGSDIAKANGVPF